MHFMYPKHHLKYVWMQEHFYFSPNKCFVEQGFEKKDYFRLSQFSCLLHKGSLFPVHLHFFSFTTKTSSYVMLAIFAQQSDSKDIRRDQAKLWSWPMGEPWQWSLAELGEHRGQARGPEHLPPWSILLCFISITSDMKLARVGLIISVSVTFTNKILCNTTSS